tara:strand:+ start:1548 stop:2561 length:1014 start_codon:yes stop_codon:yes gene_type:complete
MPDVLKELAPMSWRGIVVPITDRSVKFDQSLAKQKFSYRDNAFIESLGAENFSFDYTVPFRQDIIRGPYSELFTEVLPQFMAACRDSSAGTLYDPVLGEFRAKCVSFSSSLSPDRRDGVDVQVSFIYAPEIDEVQQLPTEVATLGTVVTDTTDLDAQIPKMDFSFSSSSQVGDLTNLDLEIFESAQLGEPGDAGLGIRQLEPPPPFTDILGQIDGVGRQFERYGNRVDATLNRTAFGLEKLESTVSALGNVKNWPVVRTSRRIRGAIERVKGKLGDPGKSIARFVTKRYMTISEIAASLRMSVKNLLDLNPSLANRPSVPPNTPVFYYVPESGIEFR